MFSLQEHDIAMLRSRYLLARRGGIPLAMPRSSSSGLRRATSSHGQGDLRITVRASPSSTSLRASHSSSTSHRLVFPDELAGSSDRAGPSISFGAPADDRMSIAASGDELGSGEDDSAALPPSGRVALPESDPELTAMLSRAAESIGEGRAYQYKALPFWLSLSPRVFTKVVEAALVPASGQPGKEQTLPCAEDLFSRHGVGLGQPHSTPQ